MTMFFEGYGLNGAEHMAKYSSIAAEFYRRRLRAQIEGTPFSEEPPLPQEGCKQSPALAPRVFNAGKAMGSEDFGRKDEKNDENNSENSDDSYGKIGISLVNMNE